MTGHDTSRSAKLGDPKLKVFQKTSGGSWWIPLVTPILVYDHIYIYDIYILGRTFRPVSESCTGTARNEKTTKNYDFAKSMKR